MTNSKKLRQLIAEKGIKLNYLAEKLGLSTYGFQLKLDGEHEFKTSEVKILCSVLNIDTWDEMREIFFA